VGTLIPNKASKCGQSTKPFIRSYIKNTSEIRLLRSIESRPIDNLYLLIILPYNNTPADRPLSFEIVFCIE